MARHGIIHRWVTERGGHAAMSHGMSRPIQSTVLLSVLALRAPTDFGRLHGLDEPNSPMISSAKSTLRDAMFERMQSSNRRNIQGTCVKR
mmetsp:Transcript_16178/g.44824  ORF Transcript_16178/g.44824 Transcript_16178/m.44824 type:complete len:90 (+) Transcript_16178:842-1111(+)